MNKKKIMLITTVSILVLLLGAACVGLYLNGNRKVLSTGNVADIEWYDPNGKEFTISTAQELYDVVTLSSFYDFQGQTIKLGADIVVNKGDAAKWEESEPTNRWYPISGFAGTFDGQGYTISGLYGTGSNLQMAMFSNTKTGADIKNFRLLNSYFSTRGNGGVASIVAKGSAKISQVYSDAIISATGENAAGIMSLVRGDTTLSECWFDGILTVGGRDGGGIFDSLQGTTMKLEHCLVTGSVTSTHTLGGARVGLIGGSVTKSGAKLVLKDCLSAGTLTSANKFYAGSGIGVIYGGTNVEVEKAYSSSACGATVIGPLGAQGTQRGNLMEIREQDLIGINGYAWTELDFDKYWTAVEESTPELRCFTQTGIDLKNAKKAFDTSWYKESQTEFVINTKEQLYGWAFLSGYNDFKGKTIKLGGDIVFNESKAENFVKTEPQHYWYSIMEFAGTLDGQGHTISGLYLNDAKEKSGFISLATDESVIKNLKLTNSFMRNANTETSMLGGIAGRGNGTFDTIYCDIIMECHGQICGGIVGQVNTTIEHLITNCQFAGEIRMKKDTGRYAGGIIANAVRGQTTVEHCLMTGQISSEAKNIGMYVGGIAATVLNEDTALTIKDCLMAGSIVLDYHICVGNVVGRFPEGGI